MSQPTGASQPGEPTERLQAIQQRLEKATPGPWEYGEGHAFDNEGENGYFGVIAPDDSGPPWFVARIAADAPHEEENAKLIANAPGDLSYLLGEVASLRQQNAELVRRFAAVRLATEKLCFQPGGKDSAALLEQLRASLVPGEKEVPQ